MVSTTTPSSGEFLLEMNGINKSFPGVKDLLMPFISNKNSPDDGVVVLTIIIPCWPRISRYKRAQHVAPCGDITNYLIQQGIIMVSTTTPSSGEFLLEMNGINKSFPGVKALDNVNLKVRPHSIHALMGENGAGKSTLLKCLFGIYQKDSGSILFQGKEIEIPFSSASFAEWKSISFP